MPLFGKIWLDIYNWLGLVSVKPAHVKDCLMWFGSLSGFSKNICFI